MTCEVKTFIRSLLKYMYTTRSKDLQTSFKKTSMSVREKKLLRTKNQKTGEEICDGPDTHPYVLKSKSLLPSCVDCLNKSKRDSEVLK